MARVFIGEVKKKKTYVKGMIVPRGKNLEGR